MGAAETTLETIKASCSIVDELSLRGHHGRKMSAHQVSYNCPLPGHEDSDPSFTVYTDENRFKCYGCDRSGSIVDLVMELDGIDLKEAIHRLGGNTNGKPSTNSTRKAKSTKTVAAKGGEGVGIPSIHTATPQHSPGCTLAELAELKRLPLELLKAEGWSDMSYQGNPAVRIPHLNITGAATSTHYRTRLSPRDYRWKTGDKAVPYGLHRLSTFPRDRIIVCEGETDVLTLWHHGHPAVGVPGAGCWNHIGGALDDFDEVIVIVEPDRGGDTMRSAVEKTLQHMLDRVVLLHMPKTSKDPSDLHVADPDGFAATFAQLLEHNTVKLVDVLAEERRVELEAAWGSCAELAKTPNLLDRFLHDLHLRGLAGEDHNAQLIYLAMVSRLLPRPLCIVVKGPSSGGKSEVVKRVLVYFPDPAFYIMTGMSERALAFMTEDLQHRMLVIYEAAGMAGDIASYFLRSLVSEGEIRYVTVEKTSEGMQEKVLHRPGPTGLILTTTAVNLHAENETRMISLRADDTSAQTSRVMLAIADDEDDEDVPQPPPEWQALHVWLAAGECRVTVPFARTLARLIPPAAVRIRRDFTTLLTLIKAHALLHRENRVRRDGNGAIVATVDDYAVVRELVVDVMSDAVQAAVPPSVREVVEAVKRLHVPPTDDSPEVTVSNAQLAADLGLDPSNASRHAREAKTLGYLINQEARRGMPARYKPGDPMPDDLKILPLPDEVLRCCGSNEGDTHPSPPEVSHPCAFAPETEGIHPLSSAGGDRLERLRKLYPDMRAHPDWWLLEYGDEAAEKVTF